LVGGRRWYPWERGGIDAACLWAREERGNGENMVNASARVDTRPMMSNGAQPVGFCLRLWRPFLTLMSDIGKTVFVQDSTTVDNAPWHRGVGVEQV